MMRISERNQRESPLLRLPAEIRNSIYEYVLGGQIIDIHADVDYPCGMPELVPEMRLGLSPNVSPRYHQKHPLALLEACHQIHSEAAPILFSTAVFNYGGHVDIETWDATNDLPVQPTVVTALLIRTVDEMLKEDRINELKYFPALKRIYVLDNIEGNQISDDKMKRFDDMNTLSKIKQHSNPDVVVLTSKRGSER